MAGLASFRRQYPQYNDLSDAQLADAIHAKFYSDLPKEAVFKRLGVSFTPPPATPKPEEKEGFFGAATRSFKEQAKTLTLADEAAAYAAKKDAASRKALLEAAKSERPEGKQGLGAYIGELLGGSAGFMAAPAAAATGATATGIGAPAAPFVGAGVGASQYTIQNLVRQAEEEDKAAQEGRATTGPSVGRAVAAAIPQAALDVVGGHVFGPLMSKFPLVKNLLVGGPAAKKTEAQLIEALSKGAWKDVGGGIVRGFAGGAAFEMPQEIAQQALERWQAGLPLTGPDAAQEYIDAAKGALVLGGGIGGVSGGVSRASERAKGLQARQRREEEAARGEVNGPAATGPVGGGDQSGVSGVGGVDTGEPAAAPAGQTAPIGVGQPVDTAAGIGAGTGAVQPALTDEEFDAQQEALQNYGDERFSPTGEYIGEPTRLPSFKDSGVESFKDYTEQARGAVEQAAQSPEFEGLDITESDIQKATNRLRLRGGDPVTILSDVLEMEPPAVSEPLADVAVDATLTQDISEPVDLPVPEVGLSDEELDAQELARLYENDPEGRTISAMRKQAGPQQGMFDLSGAAPKEVAEVEGGPVARNTQGQFDLFGEAPTEGTGVPALAPALQSKAPTAETPVVDEATTRKAERLREIADQQADLEVASFDRGRAELSDGTSVQLMPERSRGKLGYYLNDPLGVSNDKSLGETAEEALQNLPAAVAQGRERVLDMQRSTELGVGEWQGESEPVITDHPDLNRLQRNLDEAGLPFQVAFRRSNNKRNYILSGGKSPATFMTFGGLEDAVRKLRGESARLRTGPGGARQAAETFVDEDGNVVEAPLTGRDVEASTGKQEEGTRSEELTPEERASQNTMLEADRLYKAGWLTGAERTEVARMLEERTAPSTVRVFINEYVGAKAKPEARPDMGSGKLSVASRGDEQTTKAEPARGLKGKEVTLSFEQFLDEITSTLKGMLRNKQPKAAPLSDATESKPKARPQAEPIDPMQGAKDAEASVPGGKVVFQNGNYGLVRGYNSANGQPIYVPFIDGVTAIREVTLAGGVVEELPLDVSYAKPGVKLSEAILNELRAVKAQLEKAAAEQHAKAPFVTFGENGVAVSESIDQQTAGLISELKNLLLPGVKVYFTTAEDAKANVDKLTGPMRAVGYSAMSEDAGTSNRVGDGEYYVMFRPGDPATTIEVLAHELGHIHQKETFLSAPPAVQAAVLGAHRRWLKKQEGKTARQFVNALRAFNSAKATEIDAPNAMAEGLDTYWRSFDEWYADQVSRWATTADKPVNIVEKFFERVGKALRAFFNTLKKYGFLPDETFKKYLELSIDGKGFGDMLYRAPTAEALKQRDLDLKGGVSRPAREEEATQRAMGALGASRPQAMRSKALVADETQKSADEALKGVMTSRTVQEENVSVSTLVSRVRSLDDAILLTANMSDAAWAKMRNVLLPAFTSDQLFSALKNLKVIQPDTLDAVSGGVEDMARARMMALRDLADKATYWGEFIRKNPKGAAALHDFMHFTSLVGFDPTEHANTAAALRGDARLNDLRKFPQKNAKQIAARQEAIRTAYHGGAIPDEKGGVFRFVGWNGLSKFGEVKDGLSEAQHIYKMARKAYEDKLTQHIDLLKQEIERSGDSEEDKAKRVQQLTAQYEEAHKLGVYFPLFRSGQYWVKVGTGKKAIFYMFDNSVAQRQALARINADLKARGDKDTRVEFGTDVNDFRREIEGASDMLKNIYEIIEAGSGSNKEALKDQVWQMYLMTLPEADIRNRFVHRKGTEGFSADALRAFVSHQFTAVNQLSRLEYAPKIRLALSAAFDALDRSDPQYLKADAMLKEVGARIDLQLSRDQVKPGQIDWDKLAGVANKVVFYWMLTSPKSAIVQLTQLPIVGFPVLAARYGTSGVTKVALNYSNLLNKLAPTTRKVEGAAPGTTVTDWNDLSIKDSSYIKNMKDKNRKQMLEFVWDYMNDRGQYTTTYASELGGQRNKATDAYAGKLSTATRSTLNFMTGFFHQAENMSRQIMSLSAAELEYDRRIKAGESHESAMKNTARVAHELTTEALFDYSDFNKPRAFKMGPAKLGTQFMAYPLQMTAYLIHNFSGFLKNSNMTKQERKEARFKLLGTLGMTWMFAGAVGMPLYSTMCGLIDGLKGLLGGDDDDDDGLLGRSFDLWFREAFIPRMFGGDNVLSDAFKSGPISTLTGLNFGASTSLDQLWFRDSTPSQSAKEAVAQMALSMFGPAGGLVSSGAAAVDDFQQGRGQRAAEKIVPALFRGPLAAGRLASEGATTPTGAQIKEAEYYTTGRLFAQSLGFGDTEVADVQKTNIMAKRMVSKIESDRNQLLTLLDRAYINYENNPSDRNEARIEEVMDKIEAYNEKNYFLPITGDTMRSSLTGKAKARAGALDGLIVDRRMLPVVYETLNPDLE